MPAAISLSIISRFDDFGPRVQTIFACLVTRRRYTALGSPCQSSVSPKRGDSPQRSASKQRSSLFALPENQLHQGAIGGGTEDIDMVVGQKDAGSARREQLVAARDEQD